MFPVRISARVACSKAGSVQIAHRNIFVDFQTESAKTCLQRRRQESAHNRWSRCMTSDENTQMCLVSESDGPRHLQFETKMQYEDLFGEALAKEPFQQKHFCVLMLFALGLSDGTVSMASGIVKPLMQRRQQEEVHCKLRKPAHETERHRQQDSGQDIVEGC